jgi:hypothetical protein
MLSPGERLICIWMVDEVGDVAEAEDGSGGVDGGGVDAADDEA